MNEPIINPFYIYLLNTVDSFVGVMIGVLVAIALVFIISSSFYIYNKCEHENDKAKRALKYIKKSLVYICICISLIVFIPSKSTLIQMYVASKVTPQVIKDAIVVGKDFKNEIKKDIIDLLNYDSFSSPSKKGTKDSTTTK